MRLTLSDIIRETGLSAPTIRKYADGGKIPSHRDVNNWRVFDETSVEVARQLAGIQKRSENQAVTA